MNSVLKFVKVISNIMNSEKHVNFHQKCISEITKKMDIWEITIKIIIEKDFNSHLKFVRENPDKTNIKKHLNSL